MKRTSRLRNEAGEITIFTIVLITSLVTLATLYATPSYRQKIKEAQKDGLSLRDMVNTLAGPLPEQASPSAEPPKTQDQASPFKSFFPIGTADPSKQPPQPQQPPPEPVTAPNNEGGGPVSDACMAYDQFSADGKSRTPKLGSCNKAALHGSRCSHFPNYH